MLNAILMIFQNKLSFTNHLTLKLWKTDLNF